MVITKQHLHGKNPAVAEKESWSGIGHEITEDPLAALFVRSFSLDALYHAALAVVELSRMFVFGRKIQPKMDQNSIRLS